MAFLDDDRFASWGELYILLNLLKDSVILHQCSKDIQVFL